MTAIHRNLLSSKAVIYTYTKKLTLFQLNGNVDDNSVLSVTGTEWI